MRVDWLRTPPFLIDRAALAAPACGYGRTCARRLRSLKFGKVNCCEYA